MVIKHTEFLGSNPGSAIYYVSSGKLSNHCALVFPSVNGDNSRTYLIGHCGEKMNKSGKFSMQSRHKEPDNP